MCKTNFTREADREEVRVSTEVTKKGVKDLKEKACYLRTLPVHP